MISVQHTFKMVHISVVFLFLKIKDELIRECSIILGLIFAKSDGGQIRLAIVKHAHENLNFSSYPVWLSIMWGHCKIRVYDHHYVLKNILRNVHKETKVQ